jgi:flavin-dependent dehydrogenase
MQARADAISGRYAGVVTGLKAALAAQEKIAEERARSAAEAARRRAYDEFMAEIRVEDRRITRGRSIVSQERVCFRAIPLTAWVDRQPESIQLDQPAKIRMLTSP